MPHHNWAISHRATCATSARRAPPERQMKRLAAAMERYAGLAERTHTHTSPRLASFITLNLPTKCRRRPMCPSLRFTLDSMRPHRRNRTLLSPARDGNVRTNRWVCSCRKYSFCHQVKECSVVPSLPRHVVNGSRRQHVVLRLLYTIHTVNAVNLSPLAHVWALWSTETSVGVEAAHETDCPASFQYLVS